MAGGAAGAMALLGGCADGTDRPDADRSARSPAAERLRARAERQSTELLARYDATLAAHPALADRLAPLRAETARHAQAFAGRPAGGTPGAPSGSPAPASASAAPKHGAAHSGADGTPVPDRPEAALAALARAERRTADARTAALAEAPGELARLLASVAACGAAHAYLLTEGGR
ncbi:hypothetical protein E4099_24210 [Streptomyces palmae]|uniref:Lipoprotein n=1 Tax=Streptomyces palmae TaxID=1701085 RepID=A0A4Z0GHW8_9ACTN|nr:hypothetical protein E4099_24210 [Streptomyces palmae]